MLEEKMDALIAALNANTEAHGGKTAGKGKPGAAPPAGKPVADKLTMEIVKAALMAVKDVHGKPAALAIIKEHGGVAELSAIKPARYSAVKAACDEIMGAGESDEAPADDDEL